MHTRKIAPWLIGVAVLAAPSLRETGEESDSDHRAHEGGVKASDAKASHAGH